MQSKVFLLALSTIFVVVAESQAQYQFLREVKPTTNVPARSRKRQVIIDGYQGQVVQQHADATAALTEAGENAAAHQFLLDTVGGVQQEHHAAEVQGHPHYQPLARYAVPPTASSAETANPNTAVQNTQQTTGLIRLIDQHGNTVGHTHEHPHQHFNPAGQPVHHTHTHAVAQPVIHQHAVAQQVIPHHVAQPILHQHVAQPVLHHHVAGPVPAPAFRQVLTPHGVFYQQIEQPAEVVHHQPALVHHHAEPVLHHHVQQPVHFQHHHPHLLAPAPVALPVVKKVLTPVVPAVKVLKQPVIPPAVFQKEIFAIKNPRQRVLTYSDLCTVYPYQRKLSACVFKKAAIPELHHPDLNLVPEETRNNQNQGQENSDPRVPVNLDPRSKGLRKSSGEANSEEIPATNIQDILTDTSQEQNDESVLEATGVRIAESSNKNEKLVKKTSKNRNRVTSPTRKSTTTPQPSTSESTTKKPKSKRRSRSRNSRSKARRNRNKKNGSTTTTSARPFKLA